MIRFLFVIFAITVSGLSSRSLSAQCTCEVRGEYRYVVPEDVPLKKARRIAETQARVEAIAAEFGWFVVQSDTMQVQNRDSRSSVDFHSFSESEARGEWLSDRKEPQFTYSIDEHTGRQVVCCWVWGMAREITEAKIPFSAKILRRLPDPAFESDLFADGDSFYLYFSAPIDGYLAVYMRDTDGCQPVSGGSDYLFFSADKAAPADRPFVDEYVMTAAEDNEYNALYIIFSPTPFTKSLDMHVVDGLPRQLSYADFSEVAGALSLARYRHGGRYSLGYDRETLML